MLDQLQHDLKTMENKFISKIDCQHRQLSYRDQMGGSTGQPPGRRQRYLYMICLFQFFC